MVVSVSDCSFLYIPVNPYLKGGEIISEIDLSEFCCLNGNYSA